MEYLPSYSNYTDLLRIAKETGRLTDFFTLEDEFIILRHDIEFDIGKAYQLALIEQAEGVKSTYFVQIESTAYNAFSDSNRELLAEIISMGHTVGLHFRQREDERENLIAIDRQLNILTNEIPGAKRVFSCHRPKKDSFYHAYRVPDAVNAYMPPFFYRTDRPLESPTRYITDSKWCWNNIHSIDDLLENPRIQLLTHPFQWSAKGMSMSETFRYIETLHKAELIETFENEYQRYAEISR